MSYGIRVINEDKWFTGLVGPPRSGRVGGRAVRIRTPIVGSAKTAKRFETSQAAQDHLDAKNPPGGPGHGKWIVVEIPSTCPRPKTGCSLSSCECRGSDPETDRMR